MLGQGALFLLIGALVSGCVGGPPATAESFFATTPETAQHRAVQTRTFETTDEMELLSASAAVLQDLGFQLEEIVVEVGMLKAAKERSAREVGQEMMQGFVLVLSLVGGKPFLIPVDVHQQIGATLITRPDPNHPNRFIVRVLFHRTVWKGDGNAGDNHIPPGQHWMEMVYDPEIYRQFFAKLSKGLFLEAHQI